MDSWEEDDWTAAIAEADPAESEQLDTIDLDGERVLVCVGCNGSGLNTTRVKHHNCFCPDCEGVGWWGIPSERPTSALPGSQLKVAVMAQRYRDGLPLQQTGDANHERGPS